MDRKSGEKTAQHARRVFAFSVASLTNTIVGSAFLNFAYFSVHAGSASAVTTLVLTGVLQLCSLLGLAACIHRTSTPEKSPTSLMDVAKLNKFESRLVDLAIIASTFGSMAALAIITRDTCGYLGAEWGALSASQYDLALGVLPFGWNRVIIMAILLLFQVPMGAAPMIYNSRWYSVASLVSLIALIALVCVQIDFSLDLASIEQTAVPEDEGGWGAGWLLAQFVGVATFSLCSQMNYPDIVSSLRKTDPSGVVWMTVLGLLAALIFYVFFALVPVYILRTGPIPEIFLLVEPGNPVLSVARATLVLKVFFTFPLMTQPTVTSTLHLIGRPQNAGRIWVSLFWNVLAAVVGIFADDLSIVFSIVGSISDSSISYTIPAAISLLLSVSSPARSALDYLVLLSGTLIFGAAFTSSVKLLSVG